MKRVFLAALLASSMLCHTARAQDAAPPVLKVYADLVQVPVLVLDPHLQPFTQPIAGERFLVRFDEGPWSHTRVHHEGEDPIELAIVVDGRAPVADLLPSISRSVAALAPATLHPQDSVSLYVIGCDGVHATRAVSADPAKLAAAAASAFEGPIAHKGQAQSNECGSNTHLWDTLAYAANALSSQKGRRVVLVISSNRDDRSTRTGAQVVTQAQAQAVTFFATVPMVGGLRVQRGDTRAAQLATACEESGGMVLDFHGDVPDLLHELMKTLRDRYIVEFPRPSNSTAGSHHIEVRIDKGVYFMRIAGDSAPLPDAALAVDANVLHPDVADTPQMGKQRARSPNQPLNAAPQIAIASLDSLFAQPAASATQPAPAAAPPQSQPIQPQSAPDTNSSAPLIRVTTKLTLEDVTVTDKSGQPVHDLQRSDFAVREDGRPQQVVAFNEYGKEIQVAMSGVMPNLPPGTYSNQQPISPTTGASNILLLDLKNAVPPGGPGAQAQLLFETERKQSISYIKKMPAGTMLAIMMLTDKLHLVQDFSDNREVLLAALNALKPQMEQRPGLNGKDEICQELNVRDVDTMHALEQVADFGAGMRGRKNLLWFSYGIPALASSSTRDQLNNNGTCVADYSMPMHRIYGMFNSAHVAIYAMDPQGVPTDASSPVSNASVGMDAGRAQTLVSGAMAGTNSGAVSSITQFMDRVATQQAGMREIANATGGTAYYNRNDLDAVLADAVDTGSDYYSLGYVPPATGYDGKTHMIEIKVDRPGVQLHYRQSYLAADPAKATIMPPQTKDTSKDAKKAAAKAATPQEVAFNNSMAHGAVRSTDLLFTVHPAANEGTKTQVKGKPAQTYNMTYTLDPSQFQIANGKATLRFDVAAYLEDGTLVNAVSQTIGLNVPPSQQETFLARPFTYNEPIDLPAGKLFLRVGIMDATSGRLGTLEVPMER